MNYTSKYPDMQTKRQAGFAMIGMLILLFLGAVLITPTLQLTNSALKSRNIYSEDIKNDYSADAAIEYAIWRLEKEPGFADSLTAGEESASFCPPIEINGVQSCTTIVPVATEGQQSEENLAPPADDDVYFKITTQVSPATADAATQTTFTYTITLECVDLNGCDSSSTDLGQITNDLPRRGTINAGGDYLRYDTNSVSWDQNEWGVAAFEPTLTALNAETSVERAQRLEWVFTEDISFAYGDIKTLIFDAEAALTERTYCNWVYVDPGDSDIRAGTEAMITIGNPVDLGCPNGLLDVDKTASPMVVAPYRPATITYTITVENVGTVPANVDRIEDWLPPSDLTGQANAFTYVDDSTTAYFEGTPAAIARDGFESSDLTGGSGTWSGDWVASGDWSVVDDGGEYVGSYHLELSNSTGYVQRRVDLSGATAPYRQFWAKLNSFEPGDDADVLVSTDGAVWDTLRTFSAGEDDNTYH